MKTVEEQLDDLFGNQLVIRPRSLTVKLEKLVREHPAYWETRVRLTAQGWDIYDKVLYSPDQTEKKGTGYVIFCCIKVLEEQKRVSKEVRHTVYYFVLKFRYVGPNRLRIMTLTFDSPYLNKMTPYLELDHRHMTAPPKEELSPVEEFVQDSGMQL